MTFSFFGTGYKIHAMGCSAATTTGKQVALGLTFRSVADAKDWANADESDKAGEVTKAKIKVCKCAKSPK